MPQKFFYATIPPHFLQKFLERILDDEGFSYIFGGVTITRLGKCLICGKVK